MAPCAFNNPFKLRPAAVTHISIPVLVPFCNVLTSGGSLQRLSLGISLPRPPSTSAAAPGDIYRPRHRSSLRSHHPPHRTLPVASFGDIHTPPSIRLARRVLSASFPSYLRSTNPPPCGFATSAPAARPQPPCRQTPTTRRRPRPRQPDHRPRQIVTPGTSPPHRGPVASSRRCQAASHRRCPAAN